jgi:hypothetical protein
MAVDAKDVLGFAIERASALNGFWNLYIAVATGLVGIMASGKPFTQSKALKLFLSFAFVVFAVSEITIIVLAGLRLGPWPQPTAFSIAATMVSTPSDSTCAFENDTVNEPCPLARLAALEGVAE